MESWRQNKLLRLSNRCWSWSYRWWSSRQGSRWIRLKTSKLRLTSNRLLSPRMSSWYNLFLIRRNAKVNK